MIEKEARTKFSQIVSAIEYCHKRHVVHRDLKVRNCMIRIPVPFACTECNICFLLMNKHAPKLILPDVGESFSKFWAIVADWLQLFYN